MNKIKTYINNLYIKYKLLKNLNITLYDLWKYRKIYGYLRLNRKLLEIKFKYFKK